MIQKRNHKKKLPKKTTFLLLLGVILAGFVIYSATRTAADLEGPKTDGMVSSLGFYQSLLPLSSREAKVPIIGAKAALVAYIDSQGNQKFIFEKNKDLNLPIASISKLMTALIVLEEYDLDEKIIVSKEASMRDISRLNNLYVGEEYRVRDLLYPLLMESSNSAAYALAERSRFLPAEGQSPDRVSFFVGRMNQKANSLGMKNTYFINPSGLDSSAVNYSTAADLIILAEYLLDKELIWEILSLPQFNLIRTDGYSKHTVVNTNMLLGKMAGIMGGKTGTTSRAGQCFLSVIKRSEGEYLISVVLGSEDRFNETKKILDWAESAHYLKLMNIR